jgi:hypothetical protein
MPDGARRVFGVTNYHCVIAGQKVETQDWEKKGIFPGDPLNRLQLDHPSIRDHLRSIDAFQQEIRKLPRAEI